MGKIKDLSGKVTESGIEIIEFAEIKNRAAHWKCKCHCGKIFIARGADLTNGHTKSCGCSIIKQAQKMGQANKNKNIIDLTNKRFGSLKVIEMTDKRDSCRSVIWKCECDCGNIIELSSHVLKQGQISCGCNKSKGELKIAQLLLEANIPFETQKTFETCKFPDSNWLAKFDFFVDGKYLIEYDGIQHFDSRFGWNSDENFKKIQSRDQYKTQWCQDHNIPLIRIPYTKYETLTLSDLLI